MPESEFHIGNLISRYLSGTLDEDESRELEEWKALSDENEALFRKIADKGNIEAYLREKEKFTSEAGWKELERRRTMMRRRQLYSTILHYASAILIPLILGVMVFIQENKQTEIVSDLFPAEEIFPGTQKAILTLAGGEVIDLHSSIATELKEKDGSSILADSTMLNYQAVAKREASAETIYNQVDIPRGGEYALILSDGTKVHLNSSSSLRFPVQFNKDERSVELTGEAYFEVKKQAIPFIIKMGEMQVEVLGTTLNVSGYEGEEYQTTLISGSVKVMAESGASCLLKPSEQAGFHPGVNEFSVRTVDTSLFTSWVNGRISFRDCPLQEIMNALSRWYDIEVVYNEPSLKEMRFGCNIDRYETIQPFLELLELTGKVKITVENKTIFISNN